VKVDVARDVLAAQDALDVPLVIGAQHVDVYGLAGGERPDDLRVSGLDRFEMTRPAVALVRP
jgi:hypothetical protein